MRTFPGEPVASYLSVTDADLQGLVPDGERVLVLVDGRSGAGKTTVARRLGDRFGRAVVHTDDVAWHLSFFDWEEQLRAGVIDPWRRGDAVAYRPPGWVAKGRPGAVEVPADARVLVVEGVGAARASLAADADLVVWVQSDRDEARRRGIERDVATEMSLLHPEFALPGGEVASRRSGSTDEVALERRVREEAERFWDEWEAQEAPFLAADKPWTRADVVVNGTAGPGLLEIARGPLPDLP